MLFYIAGLPWGMGLLALAVRPVDAVAISRVCTVAFFMLALISIVMTNTAFEETQSVGHPVHKAAMIFIVFIDFASETVHFH